jgi:hypothetical protein
MEERLGRLQAGQVGGGSAEVAKGRRPVRDTSMKVICEAGADG